MTRQVNHNLKACLLNNDHSYTRICVFSLLTKARFSHHKLQWYQTGGMVGFIAYEYLFFIC